MTDTKTERKRLLLYLALTFVMSWTAFFAFILTGHTWSDADQKLLSFVGLSMMMPVIAHVLTRMLTKEGFAMTGKDSMMLGISFKDKKWMLYLFAMLIPWVYGEIGNALMLLFWPHLYDADYYKIMGVDKNALWLYSIAGIVSGTVVSFAAFGEEGGWRGYMMPKLIKLMGMKKAVLVGGIIWGIWHAPLTCVGHNFGMDYPGFPYLGILFMCVECTFVGIILTFVMEKSGSIWPAAILHAVNNQNPSILSSYINPDNAVGFVDGVFGYWLCHTIPLAVIGLLCLAALCRKKGGNEE